MQLNGLGYDTLKFRLQTDSGATVLERLQRAEGFKEHSDSKTGALYHTGNYRGLFIAVNANGVTVNHSLAKFFHGDNSRLLSPADLGEAITMLNYELGIDFSSAEMRRIDIAGDITLKRPVTEYTSRMRALRGMQRIPGTETVYFRTNAREVKAYDKGAERRTKGSKNIEEGRNIMRIELSYFKRISKEFGCPVTLQQLTNEKVSAEMYRRWIEHCREIFFMPRIPHIQQLSTRKDALLYFAAQGVQSLGTDRIQGHVELQEPGKPRHMLRGLLREVEAFGEQHNIFDVSTYELRQSMEALYAESLHCYSVA